MWESNCTRRAVVVVLLAAVFVVASPPVQAAPAGDQWTVLPPGNGYPLGPTARDGTDQLRMYDRLDDPVADGTLTGADLPRYFKDARLGTGEPVRTQTPRPGTTVAWDEFSVPHITGDTSEDVAFGAGWAMVQARGLIAELARMIGRSGALELGERDLFAALGADKFISYTEAELQAQLDLIVTTDPVQGPQILRELDAYVAGINAWAAANPWHRMLSALVGIDRPWRPTDAVAATMTVVATNAIGGAELENAASLRALTERHGPELANAYYDDLRAADAPVTTHVDKAYTYPLFDSPVSEVDPASIAIPDEPVAPASGPPTQPPGTSNVVALTAEKSATGHPLMVGGPQNAITYPALLMEAELTGGGMSARGALLPGGGPYIFVGHTDTYAWTSTSGESDQVDIRSERLCEPDGSAPTRASMHYLFDGVCTAMTVVDGAPGTVPRTVHGPVVARGTVGGAPVAFARQRASQGSEILAALGVRALNRGDVKTPAQFLEAMQNVTFSGNWVYVNDRDIAYAHVGRYPVRKTGAATEFPTWGTGEWEWQGYLHADSLPTSVNPPRGYLTSWNNKIAPGWRTADDDWGNVAVHRVDLLDSSVRDTSPLTLVDLVALHTAAGSTDLRGSAVVPEILAVLGESPAPSPRAESVRAGLARWLERGAFRRDRNHDLFYDDPGAALIDDVFDRVLHAVFDPVLAGLYDSLRPPLDAGARNTGSSFGYGWYGQVVRDLRRVRGVDDASALAPVSCGGGDIDACRAALWGAFEAAYTDVRKTQLPWLRNDLTAWRRLTIDERIWLQPLVFSLASARWSNRPAYEMAVTFGAAESP